jgi:hypothetical protein
MSAIFDLCIPSFSYFLIMVIIIVIDITRGMYELALVKSIGTIVITYLLHILCSMDLSFIAYIFVFYPLIITTVAIFYLMFYTNKFR